MRTALSLLALLPLAAVAQDLSPNLLLNSGFELGRPGSVKLRHWTTQIPGVGAECIRTAEQAHSGEHCARLTVEPGTEVGFYQLAQKLTAFKRGQPYTLSAWVKTEDVADGAGAYVSLNFYKTGGERVAYSDSTEHLVGTGEWHRLSVTATPPAEAVDMRALLLLHGHGTAHFDDVQLQAGEQAGDYRPSRADSASAAADAAARDAAESYFRDVGYRRLPGKNLGLLRDDLPALGCPSDPETLADVLRRAGYRVDFLDGEQLANPAILARERFDLILLPYGRAFPAAARETFQSYLAEGGCFVSTGGYAFDTQLVNTPQGWAEPAALPREVGPRSVSLLDFDSGDPSTWPAGGGPGGPAPQLSIDREQPAQGTGALRFSVKGMRHWATATTPQIPSERFFQGWSELVFRARGDGNTPRFIIEWHEADGTRWKTSVDLTTRWQQFVLVPSDFTYWHDSPSKGRGGPGDAPDLDSMSQILIGLSTECVPNDGDYTLWLDDIRIADDPLAEFRRDTRHMNTRFCRVQDAMWPEPEQIGVFDPSHPLRDAAFATAAPWLGESMQLEGPFEGAAAVGVLSIQGHGFGPDNSRLVPLLEAYDRRGRPRGALGSMMLHYGGNFMGSAWGFFGVENQDLFSADKPQMLGLLTRVVDRLLDRRFLYGTEAQYNCYRPGEPVELLTHVASFGATSSGMHVTLTVTPRGSVEPAATFEQEVTVRPETVEVLRFAWEAPREGPDLYDLRATAIADDIELIADTNSVVVWRDEIAARGPRVEIQDNYFRIDGTPMYMIGSQNWWGTKGSISQRRPADYERDFATMQDLGLTISRCFLNWRDETDKRASDAWVYLAQKHGIVMFHTPNFMATADPEVLAGQLASAREIAARYRNVPGLIVDTCNETGVVSDDSPGQRAAFNTYLQELYGTDEALREAWGQDAPEQAMPGVPFGYPRQAWDGLRARDVRRFAIEALCRWAVATRAAFRSERPDLAVTPGWGQGFGWAERMFDPPLAGREQDFTNQHYYGALSGFPVTLKTLDRRWAGQPWSVGECGARQHPSFDGGETEEQYNRRFLYLHHHAFGMGMAFTATWHWRDPMAGIFPFGKVHADFSLRQAALVERNQALLFTGLHPTYTPSSTYLLLPDDHRLGGDNSRVVEGMGQAVDTLLGLHVPFESLCEADLPTLPANCRTIVWPLPYCPSEESWRAALAFVERGGHLLITGDVGYDRDRRPTLDDRVLQITGATGLRRHRVGLDPSRSEPAAVAPTGAFSHISSYHGRPAVSLTSPAAEVLAGTEQGAIATRLVRGEGTIMFYGEPLEIERDVPLRDVYRAFLQSAAAPRLPVEPDRPDIHAFTLATAEGGEVVVAHNAGERASVTVRGSHDMSLELASGLPGLCVLDAAGRALQAEAQGAVAVDGARVMHSAAHAAAVSLDDEPLARSEAVALLPFEAGMVTLSRDAAGPLVAQVGRIEGGRWLVYEDAVVVREVDGGVAVDCGPETCLELVLLAPEGRLARAAERLAARLVHGG